MPHIYKTFGARTIRTEKVKIEKNTKGSVQDAIREITALLQTKNVVIEVDATQLENIDNLHPLIILSFNCYRNTSNGSVSVIKLMLAPVFEDLVLENSHRQLYNATKRSGILEAHKKEFSVETWIAFNTIINADVTILLFKYSEIKNHYEFEMARAEGKSSNRIFKRNFNFQNYQTTLKDLYKKCFNELDRLLEPACCVNPSPSFQRSLVWDLEKKESFIQSVINEIPVGSFYINQQPSYDPEWKLGEGYGELLWDGKQRIHALHAFILGEFDVEIDGSRLFYYEDSQFFNMKFSDCNITTIMSCYDNMRDIIKAYVTINAAQVKHTDEDLQKAIDYLEQFQA
jgi:hypothetical protein